MKKILLALFCIAIGISVYASVEFKTTCGYIGHTVGREAFTSDEEFEAYVDELNEIFCGEEGDAVVTRVQSFKTIN